MGKPWNLTPDQWAGVLGAQSDAAQAAQRLRNNGHLPWAEALLRETEGARSILDLGCGHGENSALLALQGRETTLLDWSEENLESCERLFHALGRQGTFVRGDMTQPLPFSPAKFDVIFSCGVFEYFSDDQVVGILKEAFRVAKKKVVVMVPNACAVLYRLGMWHMRVRKQWPWGGERPFVSLRPYFRAAGFEGFREFTVAARHSLNFLTMPGGRAAQRILRTAFGPQDHSRPARLRQGYLLVAVGEKG